MNVAEIDTPAKESLTVQLRMLRAAPALLAAALEVIRCRREGDFGTDGNMGFAMLEDAIAKAWGPK